MNNSTLAKKINLSPNYNDRAGVKIDTITIHHCAGVLSADTIGNIFKNRSRQASCNYGIGNDGEIILVVEEKNRSWCSSNAANDYRAITIEVSNSEVGEPWKISAAAYKSLIALLVDVCKRNGIKKLIWDSVHYNRRSHANGANMTLHKDFTATACPGSYLISKMPTIAAEVNTKLNAQNPAPKIPKLPKRGYFDIGDGYETNTSFKAQIKLIQDFINKVIKSGLVVDGCYGKKTSEAVKVWQKLRQKGRADMIIDGKWGAQCNDEMAKTYGIK